MVQPAKPNKLAPAAQKCYVLGYNQGYANLSTPHYLAVKNTANKGACCSLCQRDSRCVAWTRVAGDSPHDSSAPDMTISAAMSCILDCHVRSYLYLSYCFAPGSASKGKTGGAEVNLLWKCKLYRTFLMHVL